MDGRPPMETRPPLVIDAVVRLLLPPASREHVLGDLWERYRSPRRFMLDAARTLPFVVASQIRRTSTATSVFIHLFVMSIAFAVGSGGVSAAGGAPERTLAGAALSAAAAVFALVLRDAYKRCVSVAARQIVVDLVYAAVGVLTLQPVLILTAPSLGLPVGGIASGIGGLAMIFLMRLQNPTLGSIPRPSLTQVPTTLDALVAEVRSSERLGRRAMLIEVCAGVALAVLFLVPMWTAPNWLVRIGWALASAYGIYVAAMVTLMRTPPMPDGLGFRGSLAYYRSALARQHRYIRTMWLWYVLPGIPAMISIVAGSALQAAERGRPIWPAFVAAGVIALVGLAIHLTSQSMAQKVRVRIDALGTVEER